VLVLVALVLIALGAVLFLVAPAIQRVGVAMVGPPRNRLAALSQQVAGSAVALRSIRATGAMCVVVGAALLLLVFRAP